MRDKPDACWSSGCPLADKGKGFVLGTGDPTTAKVALLLEAPGEEEVTFSLARLNTERFDFSTKESCTRELGIRRRDYPNLEEGFLSKGAPVVGRSGMELRFWSLPHAGLRKEELFIDNVLRCLPPKQGRDQSYPTGAVRECAEAACRQYDRFDKFSPDVSVVSIHPAAIVREPSPLPLQVESLRKARDFAAQGAKVLVLAGGKAAALVLPYAANVTRWMGHWQFMEEEWHNVMRERLTRKAGETARSDPKREKTAKRRRKGETVASTPSPNSPAS